MVKTATTVEISTVVAVISFLKEDTGWTKIVGEKRYVIQYGIFCPSFSCTLGFCKKTLVSCIYFLLKTSVIFLACDHPIAVLVIVIQAALCVML